ncbi:manganese efflux pump [Halanaerobium praevalens]|uniref:manganese efflux pump n=1 Tax=Halanaerobium praevalens TaxID=2331 RepID=UPI001FE1BF3D|nr:manganese efflux pump [Halanaerobium praevalens]
MAFDAAGVTMAIGCGTKTNLKEKLEIIFSFGFFQFAFALFGGIIGNYIDANFFRISNYFSGTIIIFLGFILLREGYKNGEECIYRKLNFWTLIVLGISVSIDALGAGFSLLFKLNYLLILKDSFIIGLIAALMTFAAFKIINYIKCIALVEKYADYLGGIILILIGINILFI